MKLSDLWLYRALRFLRYAGFPGEPRAVATLQLRRPRGLFQLSGVTAENRYPAVFAFVRQQVGDGPDRRILSFGCSTGEEVFSLRRYFPQAAIDGLDISAERLAICRRRLRRQGGDPRITFALAGPAIGQAAPVYDAIFAMAVFRNGSLGTFPPTCRHVIRFADFESATADLAHRLRPGGCFAFRHANFRFSDTAASAGFDLLLSRPAGQDTPVYGRDDRLLPHDTLEQVVFRKQD